MRLHPVIITAICYAAAGMLGQLMAIPPGYATVVWPASGVALAAVLLWGYRALAGVVLGSFLVNFYIAHPATGVLQQWLMPLIIGIGAMLQAQVGAWLTRKLVGFPFEFQDALSVLRFLVASAPVSSLVNATLSCSALMYFGAIDGAALLVNWVSWWLGDTLGVILVIPWMLVLMPGLTAVQMPRYRSLLIPLALITLVTAIMAQGLMKFERDSQAEEFRSNADLLAQSLQSSITSTIDALHGINGLIATGYILTPETFRAYTDPVLSREPALQALSWNKVIRGGDLPLFQTEMKQLYEQFGDTLTFEITERNPKGNLVAVNARERHVIVSFIEPLRNNYKALGFDVYSNQERRQALDMALMQKGEVPTRPIRLVQETGHQAGVLIFSPVFAHQDNPGSLLGYATAVLRIGDLARASFQQNLLPGTHLVLTDPLASEDKQVLYSSTLPEPANFDTNALSSDSPYPLLRQNAISVGGSQWSLVQYSNSPFLRQPWGVHLILACGVFIAGLINWLLIIVKGHTFEVERQVKLRTQDLSNSNRLLKTSQEVARLGSWQWRTKTNYCAWSTELYRLLRCSIDRAPSPETFLSCIHEADRENVRMQLNSWRNSDAPSGHVNCRLTPPSAEETWLEVLCKPLADEDSLLIVVRDISESRRHQEQIRLSAVTFESQEAILVTDENLQIQRLNGGFITLTGFKQHQLIGRSLSLLSPYNHRDNFFKACVLDPQSQLGVREDVWTSNGRGEDFLARVSVSEVTDHHGKAIHYVLGLHDITQQKEIEKHIHNLAFRDSLTSLPNRASFLQHLNQCMRSAKRDQSRFALFFLDLDGFKLINDSMGHDVGDKLLQEIANRIRQGLRESDFAARLGGDEFCIISGQLYEPSGAAAIAQKVLHLVNQIVDLNNTEYMPRISIGIALYPDDGDNEQVLLKAADAAMYQAKAAGKNQYAFFHKTFMEEAVEQISFEQDLRSAVMQGGLELFFQPQLNLDDHSIVGVEALVRWQHPTRGLLTPDQFLETADRLSLSIRIDHWVLEAACAQVRKWIDTTGQPLRVAVNICSKTLCDSDFVETVDRTLARHRIEPNYLEIELADAVRTKAGAHTVVQLQQLGVSVAIDNFGGHRSSLIDLADVRFDTIKIDRHFISQLTERTESSVLLGTLIGMAHGQAATIIALGVENLQQIQILHSLGCDIAQGFYLGHPVEAEKVAINSQLSLPSTQ